MKKLMFWTGTVISFTVIQQMKTLKNLIMWSEINLMIVFLIAANQRCLAQNQEEKNLKIFDIILTTLDSDYFDTTYSGLNWKDITESFRPKIKSQRSNDTLYYLLNKVLFNLGVSHLGVLPPDKLNEIGDPQLTFDGASGLDVMYLNGKAIITRVFPNSPAYKMNLKPGYEIIEINNKPIKEIADKRNRFPAPPYNERNLTMLITSDGGLFLYPNTQTLTSKNEVLERMGVLPDIIVDLRIDDLLAGKDSQLEAAINYLTGMKETK